MNDRRHNPPPLEWSPTAVGLALGLLWVALVFLAGPRP